MDGMSSRQELCSSYGKATAEKVVTCRPWWVVFLVGCCNLIVISALRWILPSRHYSTIDIECIPFFLVKIYNSITTCLFLNIVLFYLENQSQYWLT